MANKNQAKRVPVSAAFTIGINGVGAADSGANVIGFIEGNIAITRVMLIVTEAFDGTTPLLTVTDTQGGTTATHFTDADLSSELIFTSIETMPSGGSPDPLYRKTKGQWDCTLAAGGSTVGEAIVVVEYIQLDTEPGLHSLEDN